MERLRVGIVGCGLVAAYHARNLLSIEGVEIVGLVEPIEQSLAALRRSVPSLAGVPAFASVEEMYDAVALDAVEINTPHALHHPQALDALGRGLHVLCEKPLACSGAQARELAERAAASGLTATVSYQRRVDPAYRYLRRVIEDGEIGEIQTIAVTCGQNWRSLTVGSWRQEPSLSGGGMLMDSSSHLVDVLLWLVGRPATAVSATVDEVGTPVDINATALVRFEGGAQGQLTSIGNLAARWIETVLVSGTDGTLSYETEPQHPWRTGRLHHYQNGSVVQPLDLPEAPPSMDAAWVAAITGGAPNPAPPEVAVRVAELTDGIYRAAKNRDWTDLAPATSVGLGA